MRVGIVVIGRNEGERLRHCLESLETSDAAVIYVDSGSTDTSIEVALGFRAEVTELDSTYPFTAARARNVGFARLHELDPDIEFVQFIDGDCELAPGWLEIAIGTIAQRTDVAIIVGSLREKLRNRSVYNRLCDMEWNLPAGETNDCGGILLMRTSAFVEAEGFHPDIIAGEDSELCYRLRRLGFKALRLDHEMARHDANIEKFGQWWRRAKRSGHAYAEAYALHGSEPGRFRRRQILSVLLWTIGLPIITIVSIWLLGPFGLILLLGYPALICRIFAHRLKIGDEKFDAILYALFNTIGKFAELLGLLAYWNRRFRKMQPRIIEYK